MNLFQMKSHPHGIDRMKLFLEENFVCIGWPGIGNLEGVSKEELRRRLVLVYGDDPHELASRLGAIGLFVHAMQDGDYVLLADQDAVYVGDLGDYYYVDEYDNDQDAMCHRRGVTWLARIPRVELNAEVQELLRHRGTITRFQHPFAAAGLDRWIAAQQQAPILPASPPKAQRTASPASAASAVDAQTIGQALGILKEAMESSDPERRERAAAAVLLYAAGASKA